VAPGVGDKVLIVGTVQRVAESGNDLVIIGANGNHKLRVSSDDIKATDAYAPAENGFVDRADSTMSFVGDETREFSISPVSASFEFFVQSERFEKTTTQTVTISDTEGLHYVYFDETGTIQSTTTFTPDIITLYAFCAAIYWDADNNEAILFAEERHGNVMDSQTHAYNHVTYGSRFESGLALGDMDVDGSGNDASAAQLSVAGGNIWDEDIQHAIANGAPQTLSTIAEVPMFYRSGASGVWRRVAATQYPATTAGGGSNIAWNHYSGATWQLSAVSNNYFTLTHLFATGDLNHPVIGLVGQGEYATVALAREGATSELTSLTFGDIESLSPEFVPIATIIWEHKSSYSNAVSARSRRTDGGDDYIDWRTTRGSGTGTGAISTPSWGDIGGTLANQTDLQAALDDKASLSETGTQSFNGLIQFLGSAAPKSNTAAAAIDELVRKNEFDADQLAQNVYLLGVLAGYQPLDADLTAIAALTTTAFGRSLLEMADQAQLQDDSRNTPSRGREFNHFNSGSATAMGLASSVSGSGAAAAQGWEYITTTNNWMGAVKVETGTTSTGFASWHTGNNHLIFGQDHQLVVEGLIAVEALSTVSEEFVLWFGFADNLTSSTLPTRGAFFRYDRLNEGANWQCVTRSGGVETVTDSGVAVVAGFTQAGTKLEVNVNKAGGSVSFTIDDSKVATHTTNINTSGRQGYGGTILKSAGTTEVGAGWDWVEFSWSSDDDIA